MEQNKVKYELLDEKINALEYFTYTNFNELAEKAILESKPEKVMTKISGKFGESKTQDELKILSLQIRLECSIENEDTRLMELDIAYSFSIEGYRLFSSEMKESKLVKEVIFNKLLINSMEKVKKISEIDNHSPIDLIENFDVSLKKNEKKLLKEHNIILIF